MGKENIRGVNKDYLHHLLGESKQTLLLNEGFIPKREKCWNVRSPRGYAIDQKE